ncbi:unnamed protein product [Rhizoctonia solani]|uniref:Uncharacterized protein n=1 Tax=Rhizoctonia solani TaxID=456999 RepID=A0A8H2XKD2_9AGAM|nr:unnamed protein product [Rhizoctonia solani]
MGFSRQPGFPVPVFYAICHRHIDQARERQAVVFRLGARFISLCLCTGPPPIAMSLAPPWYPTHPSYKPYPKLPLHLRLRIRPSRPRRRAMSISLTPALPDHDTFLTTGRYIPTLQGLADYLVSHCRVDGYINLSRANGTGVTDTITFLYEQGQCWATGHFTGGERDGERRTRALFKRRERTAVDYISSLLKEIANEGYPFVAVNCKTYIEPRPVDELGNPLSCLRRVGASTEKRAAFVGEAHVLRAMGARVPSGVQEGDLAIVQLDPASLLKWRGVEESKLCW